MSGELKDVSSVVFNDTLTGLDNTLTVKNGALSLQDSSGISKTLSFTSEGGGGESIPSVVVNLANSQGSKAPLTGLSVDKNLINNFSLEYLIRRKFTIGTGSSGFLDNTYNAVVGGSPTFQKSAAVSIKSITKSGNTALVNGNFNTVGGSTIPAGVALFNQDGTVNSTLKEAWGIGAAPISASTFVYASAIQPDGKVIISGNYTTFNGSNTLRGLIRFNADGTPDTAFNAYTALGVAGNTGYPTVITLQADGKILIGGTSVFTAMQGSSGNFYRLNSDGSLDTSFQSNIGAGFDPSTSINSITCQTDGKILVGVSGTVYFKSAGRFLGILRFNADGTEDTSFYTNLASGNTGATTSLGSGSLALNSDGSMIAVGTFNFTVSSVARKYIVKINANGTMDTSFLSSVGSSFSAKAMAVQIQSDGKIVVGGDFATFNGTTVNRIARLSSTGTLDSTFATNTGTGLDVIVNSIQITTDGKIWVGGDFTTFKGVARAYLLRLNSDGTEDTAFTAAIGTVSSLANASTTSVALQSDGKVIVIGDFTHYKGNARGCIVRLNADGSDDTTFATNVGTGFGTVPSVVFIQADGKILVGGNFTTFNSLTRQRCVRLTTTGAEDTAFYTALGTGFAGGAVTTIAQQADTKLIFGGAFTLLNGTARNRLVRMALDGTVDTAHYTNLGTGFAAAVNTIACLSTGKVAVGGAFTTLNSTTRSYFVMLNADGTVDTAFYTNMGTSFNAAVTGVHVQSDNKVIARGSFTTLNGNTRGRIVRLNTDGTEDSTFATNAGTGFDVAPSAVVIQADGKIICSGSFTQYNGTGRQFLARIYSDGTIDPTFISPLTSTNGAPFSLVYNASAGRLIAAGATFIDTVSPNLRGIVAYTASAISSTFLYEKGIYFGWYDDEAATWKIGTKVSAGNDSGIGVFITAAGQLQYTSSNINGTLVENTLKGRLVHL